MASAVERVRLSQRKIIDEADQKARESTTRARVARKSCSERAKAELT